MKRSIKLIALLALLVALAACYALAKRAGRTQEVSEEAGSYPLSSLTAQDMTALSWTHGESAWRFVKNDSVWVNADDASFPVNQTALDAMATRIAELTGTRELTDVQEPGDYGLAEPALTVTVEGPDGASVTYALGDATPFADGYYVSVSDRDAIYTIETSLESAFDKDASQLAQMEDIPDAQDVTRIAVGGALDATLGEDGAWRDTATGEALDGEAVASLVDDAQSLSWSALVTVSADDAALAEYGLGDAATRLSLYSGEDEALALLLGGENEDGDRYARLPDSGMVYTLYGGDVTALLEASADTLFDPKPVRVELDALASAAFSFDGGEVALERVPELAGADAEDADAEDASAEDASAEGTGTGTDAGTDEAEANAEGADAGTDASGASGEDAEADDAEEPSFTVNGAAADGETVSGLWTQLTALTATSRTDDAPQGEPLLTATVTDTDGGARTVRFYAHDVDAYLMPVSDAHALLVPADDIDRLVRTLKQLAK